VGIRIIIPALPAIRDQDFIAGLPLFFLGDNMRTGREVVEHHRSYRDMKAEAIWRERKRARDIIGRSDYIALNVNAIVRTNIRRAYRYEPFKPTLDNFRQALEDYRTCAEAEWTSHDTEYYSACGYDDYQGEMRDAARETAQEYRRAALWLAQNMFGR